MNKVDKKISGNFIKSLKDKFKLFLKKNISEREFFQNRIILWLLALNLALSLVNWAIIVIFINRLDVGIILHYNVYFGVDSIGDWRQAFLLPIIGIILFILNAVLAVYFFEKKERIASYILLIASLMAQVNLIIAAVSVIMINY